MCLLAIHVSSSLKRVFIELPFFFLLMCKSSLYIQDGSPLLTVIVLSQYVAFLD